MILDMMDIIYVLRFLGKKGLVVSFTNFDMRMFDKARIEAEKVRNQRAKVGCVITYKGHIIGRGHNSAKTNPLQKQYNRRYRKFNNDDGQCILDTVHAEIKAIQSISYVTGVEVDWQKAKVFVYRLAAGKPLGYGCAKPCPACMNAIRDLGVKDIFYTEDDGFAYLKLN